MTHPDDLLAELEGGAIAEGDRATLERHLASCARCREQVAMARAARRALASVPDAQAPADIGALAIEEARKRPAGRSSWYRWGGVAIGIAAALVLLALVAPKIGPNSDLRTAAAEGSAPAAAPTVEHPATSIETQDTNYDAASIATIADSYRGKRVTFDAALTQSGSVARPTSYGTGVFGTAATCLHRASSGAGGELVRLIRARYEGKPAYIGVYVVGPGAGQPADSVRVLVVPVGSCTTILSSAAAKL